MPSRVCMKGLLLLHGTGGQWSVVSYNQRSVPCETVSTHAMALQSHGLYQRRAHNRSYLWDRRKRRSVGCCEQFCEECSQPFPATWYVLRANRGGKL